MNKRSIVAILIVTAIAGSILSISRYHKPHDVVSHDPAQEDLAKRVNILIQEPAPSNEAAKKTDVELRALSVLTSQAESDTNRNQAANSLRAMHSVDAIQALKSIARDKAERVRFRAFAVQHLSVAIASKSAPLDEMLSLFHELAVDDAQEVRREAVYALVSNRAPDCEKLTRSLLQHSDEAAQDLAIRCARELNLRDLTPKIRQYLSSKSEAVQIAAIVTLAAWNDTESIPKFEKAAKGKLPRIQRAAQLALQSMNRTVANDESVSSGGNGKCPGCGN